jgi:arabinan endo-1,5-alpha-L-arabinosidase
MSLNRRDLLRTALLAGGSAALPWALARGEPAPSHSVPSQAQSINDQLKGYLQGLHDPVITKADGIYHVFGSGGWNGKPGISWRVSPDLFNWTDNGSPIDAIPEWALRAIPGA